MTRIARQSCDPCRIALASQIPKFCMLGKGLKLEYVCKVDHWRRYTTVLQKNNVKCNDEMMGIRKKLEGDDIEVVKNLSNKRMK